VTNAPSAFPDLHPLSNTGRYIVLSVAFLGWLFAGVHMSITQLTGQAAAIDLLDRAGELEAARYQSLNKQAQDKKTVSDADKAQLNEWKPLVARWFAWLQCAFLFGAASGGLVFGWLGDRIGRSKAMAASIVAYSAFAATAALAQSPEMLCALWFLACTGVGGMWPNGVALLAEAWSGMSRPAVAGAIGTAANIGIFLFATLAAYVKIEYDQWRWAMLVGAAPIALGLLAFVIVPESPRWLAARNVPDAKKDAGASVFRPPLLWITLVAIVLATVPMIGGWGTANWMNPWSEEVAGAARKAEVLQARSFTGLIGSLLGGWIASFAGRRWTYFAVSFASLVIAQYIFVFRTPTDDSFLFWVAVLGFISGVYFGWLPLCLPELFPTRVRATGAGVGFNFGRIVTAMTIFATGALSQFFKGDYAQIGRLTSLLFIVGMVVIWFAPDTSEKQLED
jgi:SHS family sialic acid transporter-like MFS transporter